jgi:hypothetical protein
MPVADFEAALFPSGSKIAYLLETTASGPGWPKQ